MPSISSATNTWPSHRAEAPMPMVGHDTASVTLSAISSITPSITNRKQPAASTARASRTIFSASASLRSEEHTSELQSLMRITYAVFCLKKNTQHQLSNTRYHVAPHIHIRLTPSAHIHNLHLQL